MKFYRFDAGIDRRRECGVFLRRFVSCFRYRVDERRVDVFESYAPVENVRLLHKNESRKYALIRALGRMYDKHLIKTYVSM